MIKHQPKNKLFLDWLILTCLIIFAFVIALDKNLLSIILETDKSKISWLILLIYLLVTMHCAFCIYIYCMEINSSLKIYDIITRQEKLSLEIKNKRIMINNNVLLPNCLMAKYLSDFYFYNKQNSPNKNHSFFICELIKVYASNLKKRQDLGWFLSDIILKLGLIGTIIGFVFMLSSMSDITDFDVSSIRDILQNMSSGMGTALYTTLLGLICSILSAIQYYLLDIHTDRQIEITRYITQTQIIPKIY